TAYSGHSWPCRLPDFFHESGAQSRRASRSAFRGTSVKFRSAHRRSAAGDGGLYFPSVACQRAARVMYSDRNSVLLKGTLTFIDIVVELDGDGSDLIGVASAPESLGRASL